MAHHIYALLIGIDEYPKRALWLKGCVNDVTAVKEYLEGRVAREEQEQLHIKMLTNQEATRQAVIDGFREHLGQAGSDDVALFYYSGHGSQEQAPPEFWHLEPDRLNETLVCWDSRNPGGWDLADKELRSLIADVAEKSPYIAVVLDCCHSGSGTRGEDATVRRIASDLRQRPLESYVLSAENARSAAENPKQIALPEGRHVVFSACLDSEEAKEYYGDGQHRGAFSYFLMQSLQQAGGSLSYRDLFKRANALVRTKVSAQSPQLDATEPDDLQQPFLGGAILQSPEYFTVSYDRQHGWVIDGGGVHGVPQGSAEDCTSFALFPFDSSPAQLRNLQEALGWADVREVLPHLSTITLRDIENPDTGTTFKAVVTNLPLPAVGVSLEGDEEGVAMLRRALTEAGPGEEQPSLYVREVEQAQESRYRVLARQGAYLITRPGDDGPLVAQIRGYSIDNARLVVQRLEHIVRWTNIVELSSISRGGIRPDSINMEVYKVIEEPNDPENPYRGAPPSHDELWQGEGDLRLEYRREGDVWKQPKFKVRLLNTSQERLYCALLYLSEQYEVNPGLLPGGGVWLEPGQEAWAGRRGMIYAALPQKMTQEGLTESRDLLKLIVSTAEFDATLLQQDELEAPSVSHRGTKSVPAGGRRSALNRLMKRTGFRALSDAPEDEAFYDDWVSSQLAVLTVRPLDSTPVPRNKNAPLGAGVSLEPHPGLQAKVRLSSMSQASRDLDNHTLLPPILTDDPEVTPSFRFTTSRGSDPGLSVLELSDIENLEAVTPEQPLRIQVDVPLPEEETLFPFGYDGEFFLPLGEASTRDGKTLIELERLPAPVSQGSRDLKGASRLFFQRVISKKLGLAFTYPLLAAAEIADDGTLRYVEELEEVKKCVASAKSILLYTHSLLGDTREMVLETQPLQQNFDLILTFDYENLQTPIEETARDLKIRLERVGLGAGHGKILHIVAHGIGGLIARCFVEREGGNQIASKLVLLGAPNGGSPWPTIRSWVTPLLSLGLNSLIGAIWPAKVLEKLVKKDQDEKKPGLISRATQGIDTTFNQIQPGSELLKLLDASQDPGIPYTIIAGNSSVAPGADEADREDGSSRLSRLLKKVTRKGAALAFLRQPNDMFASVHSMRSIAADRSPQVEIIEAACDHFTYFSSEAGRKALSNALLK